MGIFKNIFAPEIARLSARLEKASEDRDFWRKRYSEELGRRLDAETGFADEVERNRKREDALSQQILAGIVRVPERFPEEEKPIAETENVLTEDEKNILWERAEEIAVTTFGDPVTKGQVNEFYLPMLENPNPYLTN